MRTFYFDIPLIFKNNEESEDFISALVESEDKEIFNSFPV